MTQNLLKTLLRNNFGSKEEVLDLIKSGVVKVDKKIVVDPGYILDGKEKISVNNVYLKDEDEVVYYALNKPVGYLTCTKDNLGRKTIYDLIRDIKETVGSVGRLDYDVCGLLLLTNDKELKRKIEDPKTGIEKEYRLRIEGLLRKEESYKISKGFELREYKTTPIKIYNVEYSEDKTSTTLNVLIKGGRNREINRVFESFDHKVKYIKRVKIGPINLDIENGTYRKLKPHEVKLLKLACEQNKNKA